MDYVVGFLFSMDYEKVVLIRKNKPEWQAGKLNGIGGKVEPGERPMFAMKREFAEEAGVEIGWWRHFCVLEGGDWKVLFFVCMGDLSQVKQMEEEEIRIVEVAGIHMVETIPNLRWLIPMALDSRNLHAHVKEELPFGGW